MDWKRRTKRSIAINKNRLVELRRLRGWTQVQLADQAGYSERLILKAEAGQPISVNAVAALAAALSTSTQPITIADLIRSPADIAREFIVIMYTHQAETIAQAGHLLAPDTEFRVWGESAGLPFAGHYRGLEEGDRLFRHFFSLIESPPNHDPLQNYQFFLDHENVVVWGHTSLRPKGMPAAAPMPISYLFCFRDDRIIYFEDRFDTTHGGQLLGTLPPPNPPLPQPLSDD